MEKAKKILNILIIILVVISIFMIGIFAYYKLFVKDTTIGVNYIGDQSPLDIEELKASGELTQEEIDYYENRVLFTANVYDNKNENGLELYELNLEYFTDYKLLHTACRATGMQHIGAYNSFTSLEYDVDNQVSSGLTYYDTVNMISYSGGNVATQLTRNQEFIIKIDNKPFTIQLTGSQSRTEGWGIFKYEVITYYYYGAVFMDIMDSVKSNSRGYGDYYLTLNLSKYFTVKSYNEKTGKFVEDDVSDSIRNYAVIKFHYDSNGCQRASQSMFGQINCDSSYGVNKDVDSSYWSNRVVYTLNESDLSYRHSDLYNGELAYLSLETKNILNSMNDVDIEISLSLISSYFSKNNLKFVGFDTSAFENVNVNSLKIISNPFDSSSKRIYFLDYSFKNTNLKTITSPSNIILDISENAFNSDYQKVVA